MSYKVRVAPVVDFSAGYDAGRWPGLWEEFHCDWRELWFNQRVEPPSWVLADDTLQVYDPAGALPKNLDSWR